MGTQQVTTLDYKAIEIELTWERSATLRLRNENTDLTQQLFIAQQKIEQMDETILQCANEKIALISNTSEQINKLRGFVCHYQKYYEQQEQRKSSSILTNLFG